MHIEVHDQAFIFCAHGWTLLQYWEYNKIIIIKKIYIYPAILCAVYIIAIASFVGLCHWKKKMDFNDISCVCLQYQDQFRLITVPCTDVTVF